MILDNVMKSLQSEGIGAAFFVTEGITMEEDILCSSGIILLTPKGLSRAVFYYCGVFVFMEVKSIGMTS